MPWLIFHLSGLLLLSGALAFAGEVRLRHAENLSIFQTESGYEIGVSLPSAPDKPVWKYRLFRDSIEKEAEGAISVAIPLQRVIALSTTHLGPLSEVDAVDSVVGLSSFKHPSNPGLLERIDAGAVTEIGMNAASNLERIAALRPDVIFASAPYGTDTLLGQLRKLGLKPAVTAAYLEGSPLARAEWILFFAAFYNRLEQAQADFDRVEGRYLALVEQTRKIPEAERPLVFTDAPWGDTWWVAGGDSYMARLIADAGGRYVFDDNSSRGGVPLSLESVFAAAAKADFWINPGAFDRREGLLRADSRFSGFRALREGRVYNNNRRINELGGNDMWERGVTRPDEVLADLIAILHPELLPEHEMVFYRRLD